VVVRGRNKFSFLLIHLTSRVINAFNSIFGKKEMKTTCKHMFSEIMLIARKKISVSLNALRFVSSSRCFSVVSCSWCVNDAVSMKNKNKNVSEREGE
jgi:hypothetical protein